MYISSNMKYQLSLIGS